MTPPNDFTILIGLVGFIPDPVRAMPKGPRHSCFAPSRLRRLSHSVSVAIAALLVLYMAWQFSGRPGL